MAAVASNQPTARQNHAGAYDLTRQRFVVQGGSLGTTVLTDTIEFDGNNWTPIPTGAPGARCCHSMAQDPTTGDILLFGVGDTWILDDTPPASWNPFGTGCPGTLGVTSLVPNSAPAIGTVSTLGASPVPLLSVWVFGLSDQSTGGLPLPASLAPIGAPGCTLYVSLDALVTVAPASLVSQFALPIPAQPTLVGGEVFVQVASYEPTVNPLGLVTSNALEGTIGW